MLRRRITRTNRASLGLSLVTAGLTIATAAGQETQPQTPKADDSSDGYLRAVEEPGGLVTLEVAARTFEPIDGIGPKISLVGVSHIGESELYTGLQALLNKHEVVLYESVMPAGGDGPSGSDDKLRHESTSNAMQFVAKAIARHHTVKGRYPTDKAELLEFARSNDPRLEDWLAKATIDAWGKSLTYASPGDQQTFSLASLGADGKEGGEGSNADIKLDQASLPEAAELQGEEDNLQASLAKALGLEYQLVAIDYGQENWRCSDMTIDQLDRALKEEGADFSPLEGALAGTSWQGKLAGFALKMVQTLDVWFEGAISDIIKIVLIDMFADESVIEQGLKQFGQGFEEVIVRQRNQVVIDELLELRENEPEVKSIAVFYGAAHMPDMEERLYSQLGYKYVSQEWTTAIQVDLSKSALPPAQVRYMRRSFKQQMKRQFGKSSAGSGK